MKCTYGVAVKLFCRFTSRSDGHVHPARPGNVDVWWKSPKAYASGDLGKDTIYCYLILSNFTAVDTL